MSSLAGALGLVARISNSPVELPTPPQILLSVPSIVVELQEVTSVPHIVSSVAAPPQIIIDLSAWSHSTVLGDSEFDEERQPQSHASRHPHLPIIPPRRHARPSKPSNTQASQRDKELLKEMSKVSDRASLSAACQVLLDDTMWAIGEISVDFKTSPEDVKHIALRPLMSMKGTKKPQLWNVKCHWKSLQLDSNEEFIARGLTGKEKRVAIQKAVREDPYLQDLKDGDADAEEMKDALLAGCSVNTVGVRASNKAAAPDYAATAKRLDAEAQTAFTRTGACMLIFMTKGHRNDPGMPEVISSGGAEDFCLEFLKYTGQDIGELFEYWSVRKSFAPTKAPSATELAKIVSEALLSNLKATTRFDKVAIIYTDLGAVTEKYVIELVGWPEDIPVKSPSRLTVVQLCALVELTRLRKLKWITLLKDSMKEFRNARKVLKEKNKGNNAKKPSKKKKKQVVESSSNDDDDDDDEDDSDDSDSDAGEEDDEDDSDDSSRHRQKTARSGKENKRGKDKAAPQRRKSASGNRKCPRQGDNERRSGREGDGVDSGEGRPKKRPKRSSSSKKSAGVKGKHSKTPIEHVPTSREFIEDSDEEVAS